MADRPGGDEPKVEAHQQTEVAENLRAVRAEFQRTQSLLRSRQNIAVLCRKVEDDFRVSRGSSDGADGPKCAGIGKLPAPATHAELLRGRKVLKRLKVFFIRHGEGDIRSSH